MFRWIEVETGFEPVYAALQAAASPLGHSTREGDTLRADDGIRTRDPHLGKVMRYQLRHVRLQPQPWPTERDLTVRGARGTLANSNTGTNSAARAS